MEVSMGFMVILFIVSFGGIIYLLYDYFKIDKENTKLIERNNQLIDSYNKLLDKYKAVVEKFNDCNKKLDNYIVIEMYNEYLKEKKLSKKKKPKN